MWIGRDVSAVTGADSLPLAPALLYPLVSGSMRWGLWMETKDFAGAATLPGFLPIWHCAEPKPFQGSLFSSSPLLSSSPLKQPLRLEMLQWVALLLRTLLPRLQKLQEKMPGAGE